MESQPLRSSSDVMMVKSARTGLRPIVVKRLPEKLTGKAAHAFFQSTEPLLCGTRPRVVFDISKITEIDSSGIAAILRSMQQVMKQNGELKLAGLTETVSKVMQRTGVQELFECYDSVADAVDSFDALVHEPVGAFTAPVEVLVPANAVSGD